MWVNQITSLCVPAVWQRAVYASAPLLWHDGDHQDPESWISCTLHIRWVSKSLPCPPENFPLWSQNSKLEVFYVIILIMTSRYLLMIILLQQESKEKCCESICESVLTGEGDWKTGKTKIFLKVLPYIFMYNLLLVMEAYNSQNNLNVINNWIPNLYHWKN